MNFSEKVGKKIRNERKMLGFAQAEFAIEIGMSTFHYGEIERGHVNMSVEAIYRIAQGLGIPPYELLQIDEGRKKYILTEEKRVFEGQEYTNYGIRCNEVCITDVSADRAEAERLVNDCNKYDLDPVHLHDVVEDFLVEV